MQVSDEVLFFIVFAIICSICKVSYHKSSKSWPMTVEKIASVVPESVARCAVTFSIGLMYNVIICFQVQLLLFFYFQLPSAKQVAAIIHDLHYSLSLLYFNNVYNEILLHNSKSHDKFVVITTSETRGVDNDRERSYKISLAIQLKENFYLSNDPGLELGRIELAC